MNFPPRFTLLLYFLLYLCDVEYFFTTQQGNLPRNRDGHFYVRRLTPIMAVPVPPWGVLMHLQILAVWFSVRQWDRQGLLFQILLLSHESNYLPFKT